MTDQDITTRLDSLEQDIQELKKTIEDAMRLFSHSESSETKDLNDRRFQGNLKSTAGIQSRYRSPAYGANALEIASCLQANHGTTGTKAIYS